MITWGIHWPFNDIVPTLLLLHKGTQFHKSIYTKCDSHWNYQLSCVQHQFMIHKLASCPLVTAFELIPSSSFLWFTIYFGACFLNLWVNLIWIMLWCFLSPQISQGFHHVMRSFTFPYLLLMVPLLSSDCMVCQPMMDLTIFSKNLCLFCLSTIHTWPYISS